MKKVHFPLIISTCFLLACSSRQNQHAPGEKKYSLEINVPHNWKYYYTITNEVNTVAEVNDQKIQNRQQSTVGLIYLIEKDSTGQYLVRITYDKLHISVNNKNGESELDAANASVSANPIEKLLGIIAGSTITVALDGKGKISNVSGSKDIMDKIISSMSGMNINTKAAVEKQVTTFIGEDFISSNLKQSFKLLPDSGIYVGDSWTEKEEQQGEVKFIALTTYKLKSVKDNIAFIESEATLKSDTASSNALGVALNTDLKGTQQSSFQTNVNTGMLLKASSSSLIKGNIMLIGKTVPIQIEIKKEVIGKIIGEIK